MRALPRLAATWFAEHVDAALSAQYAQHLLPLAALVGQILPCDLIANLSLMKDLRL